MPPSDASPDRPVDLSFVIPTRNSARTLDRCLRSIAAQRGAVVEAIVVDNQSTDSTVSVAEGLADQVTTHGPERSPQRNFGAALSVGPLIAFIDSDMVLEPDIAAEAVALFEAQPSLGALVIPERAFGSGPLIGARRLEKDAYFGDQRVEAARIFRTDVFSGVGGYDERMVAGEDWDLTDRVLDSGLEMGRVSSIVWHDEGRVNLRIAFQKKRYYGRTFLPHFTQQLRGRRSTGPRRLLPLTRHLARSPLHGSCLVVLKAVEAAGFALGRSQARREAHR